MGDRPRRRLANRLAFVYSVVFLGLLAVFAFLIAQFVKGALTDEIVASMTNSARLTRTELDSGTSPTQLVVEWREALDARITVIDQDGTVLADSEADPSTMDNHADRPEVVAARDGREGFDNRPSLTLGNERFYVAVPAIGDGPIVRISKSREQVDAGAAGILGSIVQLAVPVGLIGLVGVWLAGRRLARPIAELTDRAASLAAGRLDREPRRSNIAELDRLGLAIADIASQLGSRMRQADDQRLALESALTSLPQGVLLIEPDDLVSVTNPAASNLLGYTPIRLGELVPAGLQRLVRDTRSGAEEGHEELQLGRPPRTVSAFVAPVDENRFRVLLVLSDETETRRVEAIRRDFVADASHELKTPIASVLAAIEAMRMAMDRDRQADAERFAEQAEKAAKRLATIVGDLLDLSRVESSDPISTRVALDDLVASELAAAADVAARAGLRIESDLTPVALTGDGAQLALAVRNLVDNAIRYSDTGGSVHVSLSSDTEHATIAVIDTGSGIPTRSLGRVFERFYRVDVARSRQTGGTGLGLALAKHVVERHGGTIDVQSELGAGSTFTIRLPL